MTSSTHHIIGLDWKLDKSEQAFPIVRLRNLETEDVSTMSLEQGYQFNWELSEQRHCPGYREEDGEYIPCPQKNVVDSSYETCPYCTRKIGFQEAFFFGGTVNERMQRYLAQPHYVYLAYFQPDIVKVGTAVAKRNKRRLIEQDALIAIFVAEIDGFNVQAIERAISKLGYTEAVKARQKLNFISRRPEPEHAADMLYAAWQRVEQNLKESEMGDKLYEFENEREFANKVIDQSANPNIFYPPLERSIHRIENYSVLVGEYQGLRAKYLISDFQSRLYRFNVRMLVGRQFLHSEEELELQQPPPQIGLFG